MLEAIGRPGRPRRQPRNLLMDFGHREATIKFPIMDHAG
jgi:hypothetical protein